MVELFGSGFQTLPYLLAFLTRNFSYFKKGFSNCLKFFDASLPIRMGFVIDSIENFQGFNNSNF